MNTSLGVIVTVDEVCQAVAAVLQAHLPGVLASITDDRELPPPATYEQVPTREAVQAANLPAIGIFSPGLAEIPVRDEDGNYSKMWRVTVAAYIRKSSYTDTQWAARTYAALIQALLTQAPSIGGVVDLVAPVGEAYDVIDSQNARTLAGVAVDFDMRVPSAFNDLNRPPYPGASYTVITTDTEVTHPALA